MRQRRRRTRNAEPVASSKPNPKQKAAVKKQPKPKS